MTPLCRGLLAAFALLPLLAPAAPAPSGAVSGRVFHPARGEYIASAEVRVEGADLLALTEQDGSYRLPAVPAGSRTLVVSYTGLPPARATVEVPAGGTVTRDFELVPAGAAAGTVQRMDALVVRSEREGNAKAIMEQRRSMNLTNSLSSDFFGDVAEGSVGEFLKNVPGVDVDYVGPDARGPRLRGLDPQYVGVSVDGMRMASADGSQGTGGGARSFSFDQVSVNSVDRIEINYTTSADQDADAPAGTINLKTKRAFERRGRRIAWQMHLMANGDHFTPARDYGPGDARTHKFRPGGILEYSDVLLGGRLGFVLNVSESSQYVVQSRVDHTYSAAATAADPRPRVITGLTFTSNPRFTERFTPSLTLDLKAAPGLVLSLSAMYNHFDAYIDARVLTFTTAGRAVVTGDGLNNFSVINGGATLGMSTNHAHKFARTRTVTPRFELRRGPWLVDGSLHYSISTNQYVALPRVGPQTLPVATLTGLSLDLRRSSLRDIDWQVTQTGGRDFADPANFINPRIGDDMRFAEGEIQQANLNARFTPAWSLPAWFKVGVKATEQYHRFRNPNPFLTWRYDGPGGGPTGSFAALAYPENAWQLENGVRIASLSGGIPGFANRTELSRRFRESPEQFTSLATPANFYTAFIDNPSYVKETLQAAYALAHTRIRGLQLQAGLRGEDTGFASREFDARSAAEVRAAGFAVTSANGRATTVPGLTYQYMSRPKTTRRSGYTHLFPSASAKYSFTENLQAHLGYSATISRPAIGNLGGVWVFNETNETVSVPNPDLRPERSRNLSGRLATYFEPVGSAALTFFQNDITDSVTSAEFPASAFGYEDDPAYGSYRFLSVGNRPGKTRVRGMTWEYSQALSFLPGAWSGLNVAANYTRTYASVTRAAMVPHMAGATLSYRWRRLAFGASGKWTDHTPMTSAGTITYRKQRTMIDLNGSWQTSPRLGVFFQVRNLFNVAEDRYQVDPSYVLSNMVVGTFYTFGVKGTF
jgi:TonB-dependent receptor